MKKKVIDSIYDESLGGTPREEKIKAIPRKKHILRKLLE